MKVVADKENEVYFTIHFKYHIQTIYKNLLSWIILFSTKELIKTKERKGLLKLK